MCLSQHLLLHGRAAGAETRGAKWRWVEKSGEELRWASEKLRADPDIVAAAVGKHGAALQFAAEH